MKQSVTKTVKLTKSEEGRIEELIIPLEKWDRDECLSEMSYLRNELHKINDSSKIHGKNGLLFMLSFENANKTCDIKHLKRYIARTRFQFEEWNK